MREDVYIEQVIKKFELFNKTGFWHSDPKIKARQWLENFSESEEDSYIAAFLLDNFIFYNKRGTTALFSAAYYSIGDSLEKKEGTLKGENLAKILENAVFTPVLGEVPNPTDSGYIFCRLARQHLGISEERIVTFPSALEHAYQGDTVVFLDDIIGTGQQFITTWERKADNGNTFIDAYSQKKFVSIYLPLIAEKKGLQKINISAPMVAVCPIHVLEKKSTIFGICEQNEKFPLKRIDSFLTKYMTYLNPKKAYVAEDSKALRYGFGHKGLMLGFEHSMPDLTLPIFWAQGKTSEWTALYERR